MNTPLEQQPISDPHIIRSGRLKVSDRHELYWVDWGNPTIKEPIFYLHGGPGSGFSDRDFSKFDPGRQRVVFHDQRGSGRSTPFASIEDNTTADLLSDISKLRAELGFHRLSLYGRSWGSTLALLYGIAHPELVKCMLIGGIFLARKSDTAFYFDGAIEAHFPEVWKRFSGLVPKESPQSVAEYYRDQLLEGNEEIQNHFAEEWMRFESSIMKLDYVPDNVERAIGSFASKSLAILEAYYLLNGCFIEENFILNNATKLTTIQKIVIVQGRYDFVCPPSAAFDLHQMLGGNSILHVVPAGHASGDPMIREVEHAYISMLW